MTVARRDMPASRLFGLDGPPIQAPLTTAAASGVGAGTLSVAQRTAANDVIVITVCGELDFHSAPLLRDVLVASLSTAASPTMVLDLSGLLFMDSTGLGLLISAWKRCRATAGQFALIGLTDHTAQLFRVTGLDRVIPIHSTLEEVGASA